MVKLNLNSLYNIEYYCSYGEKSTSSKALEKEASLKDIKYEYTLETIPKPELKIFTFLLFLDQNYQLCISVR